MLVLNKRHTLTMPQGSISQIGIQLISEYISSQRMATDDIWKAQNSENVHAQNSYLNPLPDDWNWTWVITGKGEYVGTFPKRVSKYYFNKYGLKCPNEFLQQLGNIARQHSNEQVDYHFDFTDTFDWNAGDFGDNGSCFWGGHSQAREILQENGARAIRFYDESGKGYARAWIAVIENDSYILFNGYGFKSSPTLTCARVLATFLGLSYKKISLDNNGNTGGVLYINNGGYIIGTADSIAKKSYYDLHYGDDYHTCENCGDTLNEDDAYYTPNDEMLCQDCFYEVCQDCYVCGETHWRDDCTWVESTNEDVCERCLDRHYGYCDACHEYYPSRDIVQVGDNGYCEDCLLENCTMCDKCNEWVHNDSIIVIDDTVYCEDCKPKE